MRLGYELLVGRFLPEREALRQQSIGEQEACLGRASELRRVLELVDRALQLTVPEAEPSGLHTGFCRLASCAFGQLLERLPTDDVDVGLRMRLAAADAAEQRFVRQLERLLRAAGLEQHGGRHLEQP